MKMDHVYHIGVGFGLEGRAKGGEGGRETRGSTTTTKGKHKHRGSASIDWLSIAVVTCYASMRVDTNGVEYSVRLSDSDRWQRCRCQHLRAWR